MNAPVFTVPNESFSAGSHPSDKEIALLAFKHWKSEGCSHLRPEHWLFAEKELMEAYASQNHDFVPSEAERSKADWERDAEIVSCFTQGHASNLATKG
jgi:hypothetical protein